MGSFTQFVISLGGSGIFKFLIVFAVICTVCGDQAVFFDESNYDGNSLTLSISGGCYKVKRKWVGRTSSVQVERDGCMVVWKNSDCTGQSIQMRPNSRDSRDLRDVGYDKRIRSVSLCAETSFRPILTGTEVSDRMGGGNEMGGHDANGRLEVEVTFYDEPNFGGRIFTLTLYAAGECYNFKSKWANKIVSMETQGSCLRVWETTDCDGPFVTLNSANTSPEEFKNLKRIGLDNRIQSTRLCPQQPQQQQSASPPKKLDMDFETDSVEDRNAYRSRGNVRTDRPPMFSGDMDEPSPSQKGSQTEDVDNDQDVREIALKEHNKYRRIHGVPDLKWDDSLQRAAQSYANYLAKNNEFQHSKDNFDLGENLAGTSTESKVEALKEAIHLWYNEISHYDFKNPGRSVMGSKAGHFTQVVWKSTSHLGVGIAWNPQRHWWVIVGQYSPAGNFKGEYEKNVFPPR